MSALRDRIDYATGQLNNAREWPNTPAPDGIGTLLDWVCRGLGWQPIETAPEAGYIFGAWRDGGRWRVVQCFEQYDEWVDVFSDCVVTPTHWAPLPGTSAVVTAGITLDGPIHDVLVGGNHLALLIGADHPSYKVAPSVALEHYGAGDRYEIWCCWRSIMRLRDMLGEV